MRFVQLYHTDWDHHGGPAENLDKRPRRGLPATSIRPCAALVKDLKQRGLLDDTLVIWGGEFGRTPMGEARETIGRDHHIDAFTMWLAGGGVKPGLIHGETDELGFDVVEDQVHVHDLQATILHLLGLDHTQADLPLPGPRLPPDRRARQRRQGHPSVSGRTHRARGLSLMCTGSQGRLRLNLAEVLAFRTCKPPPESPPSMLRVLGHPYCRLRRHHPPRTAAPGRSRPSARASRPHVRPRRPRSQQRPAKAVILLDLFGGPSHIDTFDPKPDAPAEIRGEFGTIPTVLPGVRVCEHLPLLARGSTSSRSCARSRTSTTRTTRTA